MADLRDVKEIKRLLNKAYGKNATLEDRRLAKLIMFSAYGLFGATLPYVPRETMEKGDDNMEQRKMTGNRVIDVLMEELGVEIGEEFEIEDALFNPYRIRKDGYLVSRDGDISWFCLAELVLGERTIKKIPKPEIKEMTIAEIEKELGYAIKVVKEEK